MVPVELLTLYQASLVTLSPGPTQSSCPVGVHLDRSKTFPMDF